MGLEGPLLVALLVLSVVAAALTIAAALRFGLLNRKHRRAVSEAERVRAIFASHAAEDFQRVDRLLFDLRDVRDSNLLDEALSDLQGDGRIGESDEVRERLRRLYDTFGLIDLHLRRLREARDWRRRVDSAQLLARLGDLRAIPVLTEALSDPYEDTQTVKAAAARALGEFRVEGTVEALLEELKTVNEWSSPRIAEVLVSLGPMALQPTIEALADDNGNLRSWACQVLGRLGDTAAVAGLLERIKDRSAQVRLAAAEALGELSDRRAVGALSMAVLRDPLAQVRAQAARSLGKVGDRTAIASLVVALSDSDYWTRMRAVEALEALRPDDPAPLLEAARDNRTEVAKAAAAALDRSGFVQHWVDTLAEAPGERLTSARQNLRVAARAGAMDTVLRQLTQHNSFRARARLAELVGAMAEPESVEPLAHACRDEHWAVRVQALKAYVQLAPKDLEPVFEALSDTEEMVRHAAAQALLEAGPRPELRDRMDQLVEPLAASPNEEVRAAVLELVGEGDEERAQRIASKLLNDPVPRIRARAAASLAGSRGPSQVRALAERLRDASPLVRAEAAGALGANGSPQAIAALVAGATAVPEDTLETICDALAYQGFDKLADAIDTFMGGTDARARLAVVWTLGKTEDPRSVPLLVASLEDERARVRAAAAGALGRFAGSEVLDALRMALFDRSERCRAAAADALGRVGDAAAAPALRGALKDPDWTVRQRTLVALGRVGAPQSVSWLLPFLSDEGLHGAAAHAAIALTLLDPLTAARALGPWMGVAGRHAQLLEALAQEDPEVEQQVRSFLGLHAPGASLREIEEWAENLRSTLTRSRNAEERLRAVELLAAWKPARSPAWLEASIRTDPDARVRKRAVELLDSPEAEAGMVLERALQDPELAVRQAALRQAGRYVEIGPAVLACATREDARTQELVVDALSEQHRDDAAPLVDLLMGETSPAGRAAAIRALGRVGGEMARAMLPMLLTDEDSHIRRAAAEALGNLDEPAGLAELDSALEDPVEDVRITAMISLWRQDRATIYDSMDIMAADPSLALRLELAARLAEDPSEQGLAALQRLARDPHTGVRREALLSLLMPGTPEAARAFLRTVRGMDPVEATLLRQTLVERALDLEFAQWLSSSRSPELRRTAVELLAYVGVAEHSEPLRGALSDSSPDVRLAAVRALGGVEDEEVRRSLVQAAHDPDSRVRAEARRYGAFKVV